MSDKVIGIILAIAAAIGATLLFFKKGGAAHPCAPGEHKCEGYDSYVCNASGEWELEEENSTACGWEPGEPSPKFLIECLPVFARENSYIYFHITVTNVGNAGGQKRLSLQEGGKEEDYRQIYLYPEHSQTVVLRSSSRSVGTHIYTIDGTSVTVEVLAVYGRVEGVVLDTAGHKIANFCVKLVAQFGYGRTATGCGGAGFGFSGREPGDYEITATAEGYISETKEITVFTGETTYVEFRLLPGELGTVHGIVYNKSTQEPFEGAIVSISAPGHDWVMTGSEGNYSFDGVPPGTWTVIADMAGVATHSKQITISGGGSVECNFAL